MKPAPLAVFGGTGFIGSRFGALFPERVELQPREQDRPSRSEILYFISTTDNYHVFENLQLDVDTNLVKLLRVLEHCKSADVTFNFVSSWFVYGDTPELPAKESALCRPKGFYSITKKCAEDLLISFAGTFGLRYRILRLANVYGETDARVSSKRNALQFLLRKLKRNEDLPLYHGGKFLRDYLHVDDACRAIVHCLDHAPLDEIINLGSGQPYAFIDLIHYARDRLGSTSRLQAVEPPAFHRVVQVKDMVLDVTKLRSLGFVPEIPIQTGLDRVIARLD